MFPRSRHLFVSLIALVATAEAVRAGDDAAPRDLSGWGHVFDPSRDCEVSLDDYLNRLKITVPGTPPRGRVERRDARPASRARAVVVEHRSLPPRG